MGARAAAVLHGARHAARLRDGCPRLRGRQGWRQGRAMHANTQTQTRTRTLTHTHTHTHKHTCVRAHVHVHMHSRTYHAHYMHHTQYTHARARTHFCRLRSTKTSRRMSTHTRTGPPRRPARARSTCPSLRRSSTSSRSFRERSTSSRRRIATGAARNSATPDCVVRV